MLRGGGCVWGDGRQQVWPARWVGDRAIPFVFVVALLRGVQSTTSCASAVPLAPADDSMDAARRPTRQPCRAAAPSAMPGGRSVAALRGRWAVDVAAPPPATAPPPIPSRQVMRGRRTGARHAVSSVGFPAPYDVGGAHHPGGYRRRGPASRAPLLPPPPPPVTTFLIAVPSWSGRARSAACFLGRASAPRRRARLAWHPRRWRWCGCGGDGATSDGSTAAAELPAFAATAASGGSTVVRRSHGGVGEDLVWVGVVREGSGGWRGEAAVVWDSRAGALTERADGR